jgi:endonuclease YncB( thermonuclease family)
VIEKWTKKKSSKFIFVFVIVLGISGYLAGTFTQRQKESLSFPENGLVTAVYDGDTIKVKFKSGLEKVVRLIGIDSPETDAAREEIKFRAYMAKRFVFFYL